MNELIKVMENEIVKYNKLILAVENDSNLFSSINDKLNNSSLPSLTIDEANEIRRKIDLTIEESDLLTLLQSITEENRSIILSIDLDDNQKKTIENFKDKICKKAKEFDIDSSKDASEKVKIYKNILAKLDKNDINLITELDVIIDLMKKNNFEHQKIMEVLIKINEINNHIYENYASKQLDSISLLPDEKIISEDDLTIYDNVRENIVNLFNKYGIDFNQFDESSQNQILKFGNFDEMENILLFIKNNNNLIGFLTDVRYVQVLNRILLFSSVEKINQVIESASKNNICEIFEMYPTVFYPTIKDKHMRSRGQSNNNPNSSLEKTGALNYYLDNVKLLEEIGYPIDLAYKKCSSFFIHNPKLARRSLEALKMYNIDIRNENGSFKSFLSLLKHDNIMDNIDIAIESGTYEYCKQNISRIATEVISYRIKCNEKLKEKGDPRAVDTPYVKYKNQMEKLAVRPDFYQINSYLFGKTKEDVYELYGATNYTNEDSLIYDELLKDDEKNTISNMALSDEYVGYLEKNFKINDYMYDINGVIISRYKVLRYYTSLIKQDGIEPSENLIMYVITVNSMLNQEELHNIYSNIHGLTEKEKQLV